MVLVMYNVNSATLLDAQLHGYWEGDRSLVSAVQTKYQCCGFQDLPDTYTPVPPMKICRWEEKKDVGSRSVDGEYVIRIVRDGGAFVTLGQCLKGEDARTATECKGQKSCLEPWRRDMRRVVGWGLVAMGVGFVIKVAVFVYLDSKSDSPDRKDTGMLARPAGEREAAQKKEDLNVGEEKRQCTCGTADIGRRLAQTWLRQ
ncbi:MAG: hypothetical protein Q9168_003547 [Polycauliona sp. 1 TL-2023]